MPELPPVNNKAQAGGATSSTTRAYSAGATGRKRPQLHSGTRSKTPGRKVLPQSVQQPKAYPNSWAATVQQGATTSSRAAAAVWR